MPDALRGFRGRVALVALAGVAVRLFYVYVLSPDTRGIGDWFYFHWQANLVADGKGFIEPFSYMLEGKEIASASHPPLWTLLLSGVSKLGYTGFHAHRAAGCVLAGATIFAIAYLGRRAGGERVGLLAAGLFAAYPLMIAADGSLMSEALYSLTIALLLLAAYRLLDRPSTRAALALGAAIGFATLVRSEALLFIPLVALPLAWRAGEHRLRTAGLAVLATLVVLTPWTVRNVTTFDYPVVVSTNGPAALKGANCPETYSGPNIGYWEIGCIGFTGRDKLNEAKAGRQWTRDALGFMRDHRGELPAVLAARVGRTWDVFQTRRMIPFAEGRHPDAERAGLVMYFLLLPLGAWGALVLRRRGQRLLILLAPALLVTLVSLAVYGIPRFRHAFEIPLVVLAAIALASLGEAGAARLAARRASA